MPQVPKSNCSQELLGKNPICPLLPPEPTGDTAPRPPSIPMPDDTTVNCRIPNAPSKFIQMIALILQSPNIDPVQPPFQFECSKSAAIHNWKVLQKFGSLENIIQSYKFSPIHYGSEFRPVQILAPVLKSHKYWHRIRDLLANGSKFPTKEYDDDKIRYTDLELALEYGNHKSAENNNGTLVSHVKKEIVKGWIVPLLPLHAKMLPNAMISPMGVVSQSTINDRGEIIPSNRVTHDLSFPGRSSGLSVNLRTQMEMLEPCQYGHMLIRTIHYIIALRLEHPNVPIVLQKTDFKSAYRRQHTNADTAVQCMSSAKIGDTKFAFLNLRLSFGGSACPSEWCIISETITDLANRILNDETWDPETLFPQLLAQVPETKTLGDEIPFAHGKPLLVDIPLEKVGKADVYIDDVCTVGILRRENERRLQSAVLLAMETVGRPISPKEPLPRDPLPSMDKLLSEADLSEEKCLLGWVLNTRTLRIHLHEEKYTKWSKEIVSILAPNHPTTKKVLEVTLGRLNHASTILPMARHFLCRLSYLTTKSCYYRKIHLKQTVIDDLKLWLSILGKLHEGISMNLISFRPPDRIIWTDACEHGLGGYSLPFGRAWTFAIPDHLRHRAHINILEFLAVLIGIWIDVSEGRIRKESCVLAFGDNTSAMGWIRKSKYREECDNEHSMNAKLRLARSLASLSIIHEFRIFSQWFPGERNHIADCLSRFPSDKHDELTNLISSKFSSQVPKDFKISPLPPEIESYAYNLLSNLPKPQPQHHDTNDSDPPYGSSGQHSYDTSTSKATHSSNPSPQGEIETKSSRSLLNIFGEEMSQPPKELKDWLKAQSEIPSACWLRPSWRTDLKTQE